MIANNNEKTNNYGIYARDAKYNELDSDDLIQLVYIYSVHLTTLNMGIRKRYVVFVFYKYC